MTALYPARTRGLLLPAATWIARLLLAFLAAEFLGLALLGADATFISPGLLVAGLRAVSFKWPEVAVLSSVVLAAFGLFVLIAVFAF